MSKIYTEEQKRKAIAYYVVTGNMSQVAKETKIPRTTLIGWSQSEWWYDIESAARTEHDKQLDAMMTKTIELAAEQLQDRIKNGDYRLNKKDELIRVPMSGRDLSVSGAVTYDKRSLLRGQPTSIKGEAGVEALQKLKEKFVALARQGSNDIEGEVVKKEPF